MKVDEINSDIREENVTEAIKTILRYIGEDPTREGLIDTPKRIVKMYKEIFRGYKQEEKPKITTFDNEGNINQMVFDTGDYYSMCEHHMLPFFGKYYFAYIPSPNGKILGLSKIARVVSYCSARLQLQERLAKEIIDILSKALDGDALGFAIVMKGEHLCKTMRGIRNSGTMSASYLTGIFLESESVKDEFYKLIQLNK